MEIVKNKQIQHTLPKGKNIDSYPFALSGKIFHTDQIFLYSEKLLPNRKASSPHFHKTIDEVIYVIQGSLNAVEGENKTPIEAGDYVYFKANSKKLHYIENTSSEEATFLIIRCSTSRDDVIYKKKSS